MIARTHVILQFEQPPSAQTLAAVTARGAVLLQDFPDNGVLVSVNGSVELDDLGIISAALLDSRSKISPLMVGSDPSLGSGHYIVEFHPDVDPNAGRRLILNMGLELHENPDLARQHLMVHAAGTSQASETLDFLASQDPVAYIFPASADLIAGVSLSVCGGALSALGAIGQYIATTGEGWDGPGLNAATLNYYFGQLTAKLPSAATQTEILRAMGEWAQVIQLAWQAGATGGSRTIDILFAEGAHGDEYPFDGPGAIVAHTFYPSPPNPETIAGDMHFDESESWRIGANIDLFSVALHELGHALGLGHSDDPTDVMYPYFKIVSTLGAGDKAAILTLYAARRGVPPVPGPLVLTVNVPPATTTATTISLSGTVTGGSGTVTVTWFSSSGASGTAGLTGANWIASAIPLTLGVNSITVIAADLTSSVSRIVGITRQPVTTPGPLVLTVNAYPATTTSTTVSLSGTIAGGSGSVTVRWLSSIGSSGLAFLSGSNWIASAIPLTLGVNNITVIAADSTSSVSRIVSVTREPVTTPGPLVLTVNMPPATTTASIISLMGTVTGGSGLPAVTWVTAVGAFDGSSISGTNWSISDIPLVTGLNTITVTAADATSSVSRIVTVTRTAVPPTGGTDTTGPTLAITFPSSTSFATTLASLTFRGTASDNSGIASVTWSTNTGGAGTASGTTQWNATIPLLVGLNQVIIRAFDTAGNMSWRSVVVTRR